MLMCQSKLCKDLEMQSRKFWEAWMTVCLERYMQEASIIWDVFLYSFYVHDFVMFRCLQYSMLNF